MSGKNYLPLMRLHCEAVIRKMQGKGLAEWGQDENLRDAVCMRLLALAENTKGLLVQRPTLPDEMPDIPWREIAKFRDKMAHHYEGIDYDVVWEIVEADIQPLYRAILDLSGETSS